MRFPGDKVARLRAHYRERRVCVTGGAGFIDSNLAYRLLSGSESISLL